MKTCTKCGEEKPLDQFQVSHLAADGRRAKCRDCSKAAKKPSLRKAVNAMCKHCIYDGTSGSGTWKQQVEACTATTCPLYEVRPLSSSQKESVE